MQEFFFDRLLDLGTECFESLFQSESYQSAFNKYQDWLSFCVWEKIPEALYSFSMVGYICTHTNKGRTK